jgi:HEAT repeat protein
VAAALGEVGDPVATTTLLGLLRDPVKNVRLGAARALGQVGDRRAAPALSKMLEDGDGRAVQIAAEALGRIADPASLGALVKAARARPAEAKAIADALGELRDPAAIDVLAEMLRTRPDAAAPALAKIRHPRVVLVLGDFLAEQRPSPQKPWPNDVAWVLNGLTGRRFEFDSENFQRWWKENRGRYERAASEPAAP